MTTFAVAPTESSCVGVATPVMRTRSRVATVLTLNATASTPTFPPEILVFDIVCELSITAMPKKGLFLSMFRSTSQHPLFSSRDTQVVM